MALVLAEAVAAFEAEAATRLQRLCDALHTGADQISSQQQQRSGIFVVVVDVLAAVAHINPAFVLRSLIHWHETEVRRAASAPEIGSRTLLESAASSIFCEAMIGVLDGFESVGHDVAALLAGLHDRAFQLL
eukprot:6203664-Pleurochrysis_carterae.AAC.1